MDPSEFKNYAFGMLFLKRLSDEFYQRRKTLVKEFSHLDQKQQAELLEYTTVYGDTSFIPLRARWLKEFAADPETKRFDMLAGLNSFLVELNYI